MQSIFSRAEIYSIIEGERLGFLFTHSSELSGGFSKHQLFCMCACFEVRDISLLVIAMAASMLSAPCAAYKHFPLFSSHPNKFP